MSANKILLEAIALNKCVTVTYNNTQMLMAPYILYTKHDALFVDAVTLERNGTPVREKKLGAFNLAGLKDVTLAERYFQAETLFNAADPKYENVTLFTVAAKP